VIGEIITIDRKTAIEFLLPKHYSGRTPQISRAFGLMHDKQLVAVCTFGKPASNSLCEGICGKEYSSNVYELNRLCRTDEWKQPLSQFVSACIRKLRVENWIIVSYADTGMNHNGYIYQACNFMYTGQTKKRTDKYTEGNKHSRHYSNDQQSEYRKVRTAKNRYVFFCTRDKKLKLKWENKLNYPILQYPKAENQNYVLGDYQKTELIKKGE
jgi:hypothetical protein